MNEEVFRMKDFKEAELEIITFEEDVVIASGGKTCMGVGCMCDGKQYCRVVT